MSVSSSTFRNTVQAGHGEESLVVTGPSSEKSNILRTIRKAARKSTGEIFKAMEEKYSLATSTTCEEPAELKSNEILVQQRGPYASSFSTYVITKPLLSKTSASTSALSGTPSRPVIATGEAGGPPNADKGSVA